MLGFVFQDSILLSLHETEKIRDALLSYHSTIGLNFVVSAVTLIPGNVLTVL